MDEDFEVVPDKCDKVDSVWHYFWRKKSSGEAKCQFADCGNKILKTSDGSTKGCRSHLKNVHSIDLNNLDTTPKTKVFVDEGEDAEEEEEYILEKKMSLRSSNRIEKEKSRNYADDSVSDAGSIPDAKLQDKVVQLEDTLKKFRAEVDMKMSIMQQILSTRNEMFAVQKKLIEREQALHETVLSHWKNIPDLAATGLSLKFTDDGDNDVNVRVFDNEGGEKHKRSGFAGLGKRHSSSAARRDRKKKAKTKYRGDSDSENEESGFNADPEEDPIAVDTFGDTEDHDTTGGADEDNENEAEDPNMERKVFVNYYSEEPAKPGQLVTKTPIWKYYLREETGDSALCKLCDENGVQTILKVKKGHGTSCLHKHLKFKHGDYAVDLTPMKKEMDGTGTPETSTVERSRLGLPGPFRNPIWNFFTPAPDPRKATCFCSVEISRGAVGSGATCSNMVRHIQRHHAGEYELYIAEKERQSQPIVKKIEENT